MHAQELGTYAFDLLQMARAVHDTNPVCKLTSINVNRRLSHLAKRQDVCVPRTTGPGSPYFLAFFWLRSLMSALVSSFIKRSACRRSSAQGRHPHRRRARRA